MICGVDPLTSSLVRDVREEGSDLVPAVVLRATIREVRVLAGGVQERVSCVEAPALAVAVLVLGLDVPSKKASVTTLPTSTAPAAAKRSASPTASTVVRIPGVGELAILTRSQLQFLMTSLLSLLGDFEIAVFVALI